MGSFSIDLIVLLIAGVAILIDAVRSGPRRGIVFVLTSQIAFSIWSYLATAAFIGKASVSLSSMLLKGGMFIIIFGLVFFLLYRIIPAGIGGTSPLSALVVGICSVIMLAILWLQVYPLVAILPPSHIVQVIFAPAYRFFWFVGVYAALAFARK